MYCIYTRCARFTRRAFSRTALLALLPLRRLAATTFGELGGQLLVSVQGPLRVGHVILEALHLDCAATLLGHFCLDRCCQSGNFLLRCNESRMVGLAVLFLLLGGHQLLQNANDLAALWCVPLTGTARQERKQRGTIIIGNCSSSIRANGYVNRKQHIWLPYKEDPGYSCRSPALVSNHFDIQSRRGYRYESHGFSCRLSEFVLSFSPL